MSSVAMAAMKGGLTREEIFSKLQASSGRISGVDAYPISEARQRKKSATTEAHDECSLKAETLAADEHAISLAAEKKKRDVFLGPSQRALIRKQEDPPVRTVGLVLGLMATVYFVVFTWVVSAFHTSVTELPRLALEVALFVRTPQTALDNAAAAMAFLIALPSLLLVDVTLCERFSSDAGARWYLLHAIGNMVVAGLCVPDLWFWSLNPPASMSASYCRTLPFPGCSDWPTVLIVAMHVYHMMRFKLTNDDLFHHLLFVPLIGGIHFCYPLGVSNNILAFFISGLPGALDYLLLALVKEGHITSFIEKRLNCSCASLALLLRALELAPGPCLHLQQTPS